MCTGSRRAGAAAARASHMTSDWLQAFKLSSRRYCILSRGYKFKTLLRHVPGARPTRRRPRRAHASHMISDWQSLAASLTWSCRSCVTVLALQQYVDARCGPLTAGDWGQQLTAKDGPGKGHHNNLKCSTSALKVFSCYAAARMFAMK